MPGGELPENHQDVEGRGHKTPTAWHTPNDMWHYSAPGPASLICSYLFLFQISAWFGSLTDGYGVSVAVLPLQTAGRPVPALQLEPLGTGCVRKACSREHCFAKNQSFPSFSVTVFPCGRCHMALQDNRTGWAAGLVRATGNCV